MEPVQGRLSVFVNGRARQVGAATTLDELATECRLNPKGLLVELNGQTLLHEEWPGRTLAHGDRIEFVRIVAGG